MNARLLVPTCFALTAYSSVALANLPAAYDFTFIPRIYQVSDINNAGQVVGSGSVAREHAYLWEGGVTTILGDSNAHAAANSINNRGQVVGTTWPRPPYTYEYSTAMLWTRYTTTPLDPLEPNGVSEALGNNNHGQIVGFSTAGPIDPYHDPEGAHRRVPVLWDGTTPTRLGNPEEAGGVMIEGIAASDINNKGQIVGWGGNRNESGGYITYHALMWGGDEVIDLDPGDYVSRAEAINDAGQVVGTSSVRDPDGSHFRIHAYLWDNGVSTDLGALDPYQYSGANDINNDGEIVGYSILNGNYFATLWDQKGRIYDLNSFLDTEAAQAGWQLEEAIAINDLGQIVGHAYNSNWPPIRRTFLLTPVPEPETYAMLMAGLGVIGLAARKRKRANNVAALCCA